MHHRMMNLPVAGPLGVAALLAGPLARFLKFRGHHT
jgi:hypothetical protein